MFHDIARHEELSRNIIGCAIKVHKFFGPGLFESVYQTCLVIELREAGMKVEVERPVPITYRGRRLGRVFYPDLIVNDQVIVEIKCVAALTGVHTAQMQTYLKLQSCDSVC
jgi:GxxExxY protein